MGGSPGMVKSPMRMQFEEFVKRGRWPDAAHRCNALAMAEMLPALEGMSDTDVSVLLAACQRALPLACTSRIRWASELVHAHSLPQWTPADLPPDQFLDGHEFVESYTRRQTAADGPVNREARTAVFNAVRGKLIKGWSAEQQLASVEKHGYFMDSGRVIRLADAMYP